MTYTKRNDAADDNFRMLLRDTVSRKGFELTPKAVCSCPEAGTKYLLLSRVIHAVLHSFNYDLGHRVSLDTHDKHEGRRDE